ncbi:hypothetical protein SNOG_01924 [Parastagonospora nodorum SN15]|uniref:DUF4045 domain-containing protein n=1 Tax=Phaeosphaeria nodorum (strain SN15 / ATCC MYA-4574 / FGSC 10173) TaxID=321614 RepID=Q0V240_PHANO|nr:hypothetical protein SNOG_01924 [Parastagonospora nodorum SN15]EAT90136.2 hypothetical protein SNOG_01924 [Parastagonospora nodorum SN15]
MSPPRQDNAHEESLQRLTSEPAPMTLEDTEPKKPVASAAALGRSGTLSWKQRPQSGSLRRPLSMASRSPERSGNTSPTKTSEPSSPEPSTSRTSIAASLGAKDPSWFKQTPDRGVGSAAYRRSQDEAASDTGSISGRRQLPGMSRESTVEPEIHSPPPESMRSSSPGSRGGSVRGSAMLNNRFSTSTSISLGDADPAAKTRSPLPMLDSQKFAPPSEQGSAGDAGDRESRALAMSPTQGRISPERERSASPTKGMGGFVQSAMLKRSDSVSKRWSTQTPPTLTRQGSTLSNRGSAMSGYVTKSTETERAPREEFVKPALPRHNRSKSVASSFHDKDQSHDETSPPSPSKRWSPTKSSWLESALNKPESPKLKQPPPAQPAWMAEINRIKQQRSSVDLGRTNSAEPFGSGRTSPIKDVQLKPASLRKFEIPKKESSSELDKIGRPSSPLKFDTPKKEPTVDVEKLSEPSPRPIFRKTEEANSAEVEAPAKEESVASTRDSSRVEEAPVKAAIESAEVKPLKASGPPQPLPKSRPGTPPKKDFRAGLKPRQPIDDGSKKGEVTEFQNVFGKLRKAETKNYVAPDVLKTNILTGKNALNQTGGPKPTVRRDEFRESLIKKKSTMQLKAQEEGSVLKKADAPAEAAPPPEAIARRGTLGRADSVSKPAPLEKPKQATPEALARKKSLRVIKPAIDDKPVQPTLFTPKEPAKASKLADRFNPALAGMLARGPPSLTTNKSTSSADGTESPSRPVQEERKPGPAPELQHMTKGRAKGPKRRPAAKQANSEPEKMTPQKVTPDVAVVPLVKPEHVLPSSVLSKTNGPSEELPLTKTPSRQSITGKPATPAKSARISSGQYGKSTPEPSKKPASLEMDRVSGSQDATMKSPRPDSISSPRIASPGVPKKPASLDSERRSPKPEALREIDPPNVEVTPVKNETSPERSSFASVKSATALWGRQSASSSPLASRTKTPIKLPTKADEQAAMQDAGLVRSPEASSASKPASIASPKSNPMSPVASKPTPAKPKPTGLGFSLSTLGSYLPARSRESTPQTPSNDYPTSPPLSGGRPQSEPFKGTTPPAKHDGLFAEFFDDAPITEGRLPEAIDTVRILKTPPIDFGPSGKIRTLRKQIHEVTGDGKLTPIPEQEEHILFQDSLYLCTHIFSDSKGAKHTDVYLWAGNGVAEPIIEDVQLFAKNHAKQNQGRLVTVRQGHEPPNFFEALGGIVITRRGAKPAAREFMLCGRRHIGHLAFDEVDLSLKSLCSAFPYLISAPNGKFYVWKGRGCCPEELAGARLMSMDLNPTGDITEIDEGNEPQDFIEAFPPPVLPNKGKGPAIPRSADHWRYKATSEKYRARLYKIEPNSASSGWGQALQVSSSFFATLRRPSWSGTNTEQRPQTPVTPGVATMSVKEIMPFCQRDLEPETNAISSIIGALSRTQSQAFSTALLFAQEYGILAVSEEDRPFMPVTTVVMEGVPRDMKAVFRHWDDALIPAAGLMRGKLGRGKSLRIVGLDKAIEATRR